MSGGDVRLSVCLRPVREADLDLFARFATDPEFSEPFEWGGFRWAEGYRERWSRDGFLEEDPHLLIVADDDDTALGWVMFRDPQFGGRRGLGTWETGILLAPEHRGRGAGTAAQCQLAEYLFANTPAHRLTANTEVDNLREQRALEKAGFEREGVLRRAGYRGGAWRDLVVYARLRDDFAPVAPSEPADS